MRYTKNNDGFYNVPQQMGYAQTQRFTPQVTIKDDQDHIYNVSMDMSVPYISLTPKMVKDFKKMEDFIKGTTSSGPGKSAELKQLVLMKAIGMDEDYVEQYREEKSIPQSNNSVWKLLCQFYNQEFLQQHGQSFSINKDYQFNTWVKNVLLRYGTHHYPGVSDDKKIAIVRFYLVKCHDKNKDSIPDFRDKKLKR